MKERTGESDFIKVRIYCFAKDTVQRFSSLESIHLMRDQCPNYRKKTETSIIRKQTTQRERAFTDASPERAPRWEVRA